jgi:hypothetical protein
VVEFQTWVAFYTWEAKEIKKQSQRRR